MSDELWNEKLTRENLKDFYMSTVDMVYSSVFEITQEPTRCERAIVKSYLDIYAKRANVPAERVIYDFGDILLENAKSIVAEYPLPEGLSFKARKLDEYTRNSMFEKVLTKIESSSTALGQTTVINKAGNELPETGGMGTKIFYVLGTILFLGAGVVLIARRKASQQ